METADPGKVQEIQEVVALDVPTPPNSNELPAKRWFIEDSAYVRALDEVVCTCLDDLKHLFTESEIQYAQVYRNTLSAAAKCLYARVLQRKERCLRTEDMARYLPPDLLRPALKELVDNKLFVDTPPLRELMDALTVKELAAIVRQQKGIKGLSGRKEEIIEAVWLFVGQQRTVLGDQSPLARMIVDQILEDYGPFYRLDSPVAAGFRLMINAFVRPSHSSFEDLCLQYFRKTSYALYTIEPGAGRDLFPTRESFVSYNECVRDAIALEERWGQWDRATRLDFADRVLHRAQLALFEASSVDVPATPPWRTRYTAQWANMDLLLKLSEALRLVGMTEEEYNCLNLFFMQRQYRREKRAVYLVRKAHLELGYYSRRKNPKDHSWLTKALESCLDAMCDPSLTDIVKIDLHKKALKVGKAHQVARLDFPKEMIFSLRDQLDLREATYVEIYGDRAPTESDKVTKTSWYDPVSRELISVESVALNHYQQRGYCGYHSESSIVTTIVRMLQMSKQLLYGGPVCTAPRKKKYSERLTLVFSLVL